MGAFLLGAVSAALLVLLTLYIRESAKSAAGSASEDSPASPPPLPLFPPAGERLFTDAFTDRVYALQAKVLGQPLPSLPQHFLQMPAFLELVGVMSDVKSSNEALFEFAAGEDAALAWAALVALARRPPDPDVEVRLLQRLNGLHPWSLHFILHVLEAWRPDDPTLAGRALVLLDASWGNIREGGVLDGFLRRRAAVAPPTLKDVEPPPDFDANVLRTLLRKWADPEIARPLLAELDALAPPAADGLGGARGGRAAGEADVMRSMEELERRRTGEVKLLADLGRVTAPHAWKEDGLLGWPTADGALKRACAALAASPPRSVLVVGEPGVGKSSLARRAAAHLSAAGWTVFEASGGQVNSGMVYVGALENRIRSLLSLLRATDKVVWVVPDLHELMWAGRHDQRNAGVLEMLLPALEAGELLLLGEAQSAALERILTDRPEVTRLFEVIRLEPPSESETATLVDRWAAGLEGVEVPPAVRAEAAALARQYLQAEAPPGGVLRLLKSALSLARLRDAGPGGARALTPDDLVEALAQATGLPLDILDERCEFDAAAVRRRFEARVIGQPEAVGCLVERLALLKAGVTDPGRPTGVFLFVGGSGTGKTMLARTLAEYLFGSPERLVRLDMSEMHGAQALDRLLGEERGPRPAGNSLVERVRRQPFSVVLLDEFDRAHPDVWDMFLQVFDAGRLTDRRGETADFRHAIIILTSNLGAATNGVRLGLVGGGEGAGPAGLQRAVERTFRPEFLNRLDRVVAFRPLTREVMRRILRQELAEAFARRGLRRRDWAVELEDSAIDLLVEQGFSPTLGARPLKRELERLLLTPLAAAIVNRSAPEGNQFLFVRADGDRLAVQFVDPDTPAAAPPPAAAASAAGRDLAAILYEPHGGADEVEALHAALLGLQERVQAEAWASAKQALLLESAAPGFWERPERFERLGRAEYMDRVEGALRSAASLLERLRGGAHAPRRAFPRDMVRRLAQQLYLLEAASGEAMESGPRDAFVAVEPSHEDVTPADATRDFAHRVTGMYEAWARARGMRFADLGPSGPEGGPRLLAVSGFAAHRLLAPEAGLHVLEWDEPGGKGARRATVRVRVEPQPATPARDGIAGLRRQAEEALGVRGPLSTTVVRRYREAPSPLVRDLVRCWRTGRIERVLGGDFDVIPVRE
jgi:ATP-dependent Clp protease ATP-binding subunit ClpC